MGRFLLSPLLHIRRRTPRGRGTQWKAGAAASCPRTKILCLLSPLTQTIIASRWAHRVFKSGEVNGRPPPTLAQVNRDVPRPLHLTDDDDKVNSVHGLRPPTTEEEKEGPAMSLGGTNLVRENPVVQATAVTRRLTGNNLPTALLLVVPLLGARRARLAEINEAEIIATAVNRADVAATADREQNRRGKKKNKTLTERNAKPPTRRSQCNNTASSSFWRLRLFLFLLRF